MGFLNGLKGPNTEEKLRESMKNIRIDGLPNIFRADFLVFKTAWFLIFICLVSFCSYLTINSFLDYFKYQVTTTYRQQKETSAIFPTISICNINPLNTEYYVSLLNAANLTSSINSDAYENFVRLEYYQMQTAGRYFTSEEKRALINLDGFIISCYFQNKPCNKSDFRYLFFPYFLNCIQFNSGYDSDGNKIELRTSHTSGDLSSLSMELYVGIPNEISSLISGRGVFLTITNNTENPSKNSPSQISVTPGIGLRLSILRNKYNQFNQWPFVYSECSVDEEGELMIPLKDMILYEKTISTNYIYDQDSCLLLCYNYYMNKVCNCTDYWINWRIEGYGYCLSDLENCSNDFYYNTFNIGNFIAEHCMDKCPLQCSKHRYDNYKSFYKYPDQFYVDNTLQKNEMLISHFSNQTDFTDNLASNVVKFSILYDSLVYFEIKEEAKMPWDTLLGILGGHLHLFLGMSFVSIVEIFELSVEALLYFKFIRKRKTQIFFKKSTI